jgi:hypothetical protein
MSSRAPQEKDSLFLYQLANRCRICLLPASTRMPLEMRYEVLE